MNLPAQRLLVFLALCTAFGAAVWFLDAEDSRPHALLAAVGEPTIDEGKCVAECTKESGEKFKCGKSVTVNEQGQQQTSKADPGVRAGTCRTTYKGKDGKDVTVDENDRGRLVDELGREIRTASDESGPGDSRPDTDNTGSPVPTPSPYPTGPTLPGSPAPTPAPSPSTPPSSSPAPSAPSAPAPSPAPGPPSGSSGSTGAGGSTFSPSSGLTNSTPFSLGSLFGGGPSAGGGQGGGYGASSGGAIAYAPPTSPVYQGNRGFEAMNSRVTFAEPLVTPNDLIARLAQNTQKQSPTRVTADTLGVGGIVSGIGDTFRAIGEAVLTPITDFFSTVFSLAPETDRIASIAKDPEKRPDQLYDELLKMGDLTLVAGDPTEIFADISEIAKQAPDDTPPNPFFEGVMVRTDPWKPILAMDLLRGLLSFDVNGSVGEESLETPPESYPSGEEVGGGTQGAIQGAMEGSKPKSAFSAMRLSLGAIGDALANLFKNFFNSLFWWV